MLAALARLVHRRRGATLALSAGFLVLAVIAVLRGGPLTAGGFGESDATDTERLVAGVSGSATDGTFIVLFHSDTLDPRNEAFQRAMTSALAPLAHDPHVLSVMTPDDAPPTLAVRMVSPSAKRAVAMVSLRGSVEEAVVSYPDVRTELASPVLSIACTGYPPFLHDFEHTLQRDLVRAELLSLPLALLVLLLAFRTAVAAALPVGVGALAVLGGIAAVLQLSHVVNIAAYTVNVCSVIGLGVAIDYSLFIVSRYREALADGHGYEDALVVALEGAGRVVGFSGLALATGLGGLLFFRGSFLAAMGLGGMVVVTLAMVFALTFLPALLAVLGPKIHALRLPGRSLAPRAEAWHAVAAWVMRHPVLVLVPTLALLVGMGLPFLRIALTAADVRVLARDVEARQAYETLKRDFPELAATRVVVAVEFPTSPALDPARIDALYDLGTRIGAIPHVARVESIVSAEGLGKEDLETILLDPPALYRAQIDAAKRMTVGPRVVLMFAFVDAAPESREAADVVRALRAFPAVAGGTLHVGGQTALNVDATAFVRARTPWAVGFVVLATLVLLSLLLGSVVLPVKAVLMNALSLTASFGALVWVFQEGHLGLAEPRPIDHALPVLLFCVLFGISMDYEVLMLSRMKEAYDRTRDNTAAVAEGLERTAGLISSAAAIMVVVFGAFAMATVVQVRAMGFGMALAVAVDATLVRILLVPATMRLFGDLNWWAPAPLRVVRVWLGLGR